VPWAWTRRQVALEWNVPPWVVDEAPIDEVLTAVRLMNLEQKATKAKK
jgi:hypothetical protein